MPAPVTARTPRFDQIPQDKSIYALCNTCGIELRSEVLAGDHVAQTNAKAVAAFAATGTGRGRGHTLRVLNPSRPVRIQRYIDAQLQVFPCDTPPGEIAAALMALTRTVPVPALSREELVTALVAHPDVSAALPAANG